MGSCKIMISLSKSIINLKLELLKKFAEVALYNIIAEHLSLKSKNKKKVIAKI